MKLFAILMINYSALSVTLISCQSCNTSLLRLWFMHSCGRMKRDLTQYDENYEFQPLPLDTEGLTKLLREKFKHEISEEMLHKYSFESNGKPDNETTEEKQQKLTRLMGSYENSKSNLDVPGFPLKWKLSLAESAENLIEKKNRRRRSVDKLIEACCNGAPHACTEKDFIGICK